MEKTNLEKQRELEISKLSLALYNEIGNYHLTTAETPMDPGKTVYQEIADHLAKFILVNLDLKSLRSLGVVNCMICGKPIIPGENFIALGLHLDHFNDLNKNPILKNIENCFNERKW